VLFLMDPRGRAVIPLRLFRSAAERYGYVVMSSYQTQSDGPIEPNDKAVNAMLEDAQSRFSVDVHRLYFAGFSGTGRLAWYYAYSIPDNVAGLIEAGAGLPAADLLLQKSVAKARTPFAVFLAVGTTDFNYAEVRALDPKLQSFGIRHHLEVFDGPHGWPPEFVCFNAVSWMELQAMRDGRLATNSAWIDSLFNTSVAAIDAQAGADAYTASQLYRQAAADFAGLHDTNALDARADRLAESAEAKRTARHVAQLADDDQRWSEREESFFADFARANPPARVEKLRSQLNLDELGERTHQTTDTLDALSARRRLASLLVRASFYEPRRFLAQADTLKALTMYALAQSIQPDNTQLCVERDKLYRTFALPEIRSSRAWLRSEVNSFPLPASRFPLPASRFPLPASRFPLPAQRPIQ
jgi:dienelactone hydrolase